MIKLLLFTICLGFSFQVDAQSKVYKYTDEDGKVHYTDKKPSADAQEEKLKSIIIIPVKDLDPVTSTRRREEHKEVQAAKKFENFVINTPSAGSTISGSGGNVLATVNLQEELHSNYRIKFYIDGLPHGKVKSDSQLIGDVFRGEHTIYAEMIEASTRRVILTTPPVTFYVRQHSKK